MVKGYTQEYVYKHPWERVTAASWRKFADPKNRSTLSHILEVDTVSRTLDSDSGKLYSTRVLTVNTPGPLWLQRLLGQKKSCHCLETSVVDAKNRSMHVVTRNISLKDFVEVEEKACFTPHPQNPQWTLSKQETTISCATSTSTFAALASKVEHRCADIFQHNSVKGRHVMETICNYLEAEANAIGAAL